jgi:hypothetical protein
VKNKSNVYTKYGFDWLVELGSVVVGAAVVDETWYKKCVHIGIKGKYVNFLAIK